MRTMPILSVILLFASVAVAEDKPSFVFAPDGKTVLFKDGDTVLGTDHQFTKKQGDTYFHSDGTFSKQQGNMVFNSDGSWIKVDGNTATDSTGRVCTVQNKQMICNR